MQRYDELMITPVVQALQEAEGSREMYARSYGARTRVLGPDDIGFLESRSSIYMASVSETGWPYIQHRGGPVGFLKILDDHTLGFADYKGNKQHISEGNVATDARVSLFAMDYPRKARLKLQGRAVFQTAAQDPDLAQRLAVDGQGRVERLVTIEIDAFDWNCPQFITPRFDASEIAQLVAPEMDKLTARIAELEAENASLRRT